jgi:hypothetical protein
MKKFPKEKKIKPIEMEIPAKLWEQLHDPFEDLNMLGEYIANKSYNQGFEDGYKTATIKIAQERLLTN